MKEPEDRWAGKPQWMKDSLTKLDDGLEPFGDISIEDRRRRYLDAISNDKADDERLVDPRVAAARIARALFTTAVGSFIAWQV